MDADWGSSSDEEDAAERAQRDAEKPKETMALLEAFERTREPVKADYGSTGEQFRHERAQAAGRAQWEERRSRAGAEKEEEKEIKGAMKCHIILGCIIIFVLLFALVGVYNTLGTALKGSPGNATNRVAPLGIFCIPHIPRPRAKVVLFALFLGVSIPTFFLVRRQLRANKTKSFQGHFYRGVDHG